MIKTAITALCAVVYLYKERGHQIDEIQAKHKIECTGALVGLAATNDRINTDRDRLYQAWPTN